MKVRYTPRAIADIEDIHAYIADRNPQASVAVVARIKQAIEGLGDFPGMGRMTERGNVRVLPVGRYPYLIFYRIGVAVDEIVIIHVRHGARRRPGSLIG